MGMRQQPASAFEQEICKFSDSDHRNVEIIREQFIDQEDKLSQNFVLIMNKLTTAS